MIILIITIFLSLVSTLPVYSEFYRWVDDRGNVHFTDNPASIPERDRDKTEIKEIPQTDKMEYNILEKGKEDSSEEMETLKPMETLKASEGLSPKEYVINLKPVGSNFLAEALLNLSIKANLMVDTGASITLISRSVADKLGIEQDSNLPKLPFSTTGGIVWQPLIMLRSLKVGDVEIKDIEVSISSSLKGLDGLIGMNFLDEFDVSINSATNRLILREDSPKGEIYGGHGKIWWTKKFRHYSDMIKDIKDIKRKIVSQDSSDLRIADIKEREEYKNVLSVIRHYENLLRELDSAASKASVPMEWREYP